MCVCVCVCVCDRFTLPRHMGMQPHVVFGGFKLSPFLEGRGCCHVRSWRQSPLTVSRFGLAARPRFDSASGLLYQDSGVVVYGHCLVTLLLTINETLKWLSSLPILMQESFWWWQCSDRYTSVIPPPPFSVPNKPDGFLWTLSTMFTYPADKAMQWITTFQYSLGVVTGSVSVLGHSPSQGGKFQ